MKVSVFFSYLILIYFAGVVLDPVWGVVVDPVRALSSVWISLEIDLQKKVKFEFSLMLLWIGRNF